MSWELKEKYKKLASKDRLYQSPIPLIGLTGGIASGKSTVAQYLSQVGFEIIDADQEVKKIYLKKELIEFVAHLVPQAVEQHRINFTELRKVFFTSPEIKQNLEKKIYSLLEVELKRKIEFLKNKSVLIYDVPLLYENNLEQKLDQVIVVYVSPEIQKLRLSKRDQMGTDLTERILSSQWPIEEKKNKTPFVINNEKEKNDFLNWPEVDLVINELFIRR